MTPDGTAEYLHFNADGELEAIEWNTDAQEILDANLAERNEGNNGYGKTREWKHIARIDLGVIRSWEVELGVPIHFLETKEGLPVLLKKIKDPDFKYFRTDK